MLKLHQNLRNRVRFLIIFCLILLFTLLFQGHLTAIVEKGKLEVENRNEELKQINKNQQEQIENINERIKKLEKDIKTIEVAKRKKQEKIRLAEASQQHQVLSLSLRYRKILTIVYDIWWKDQRFHKLLMCESGYDNWADGYDAAYDQHNYGIFQVSDGHGFSQEQLADSTFNITKAKQIWDARKAQRGEWWAWYAWPNCSKEAGFI